MPGRYRQELCRSGLGATVPRLRPQTLHTGDNIPPSSCRGFGRPFGQLYYSRMNQRFENQVQFVISIRNFTPLSRSSDIYNDLPEISETAKYTTHACKMSFNFKNPRFFSKSPCPFCPKLFYSHVTQK